MIKSHTSVLCSRTEQSDDDGSNCCVQEICGSVDMTHGTGNRQIDRVFKIRELIIPLGGQTDIDFRTLIDPDTGAVVTMEKVKEILIILDKNVTTAGLTIIANTFFLPWDALNAGNPISHIGPTGAYYIAEPINGWSTPIGADKITLSNTGTSDTKLKLKITGVSA